MSAVATCITFKTPPAASFYSGIPQILFFWIYKIQSPSLCFGILQGMRAQNKMANAQTLLDQIRGKYFKNFFSIFYIGAFLKKNFRGEYILLSPVRCVYNYLPITFTAKRQFKITGYLFHGWLDKAAKSQGYELLNWKCFNSIKVGSFEIIRLLQWVKCNRL